MRCSICDRDHEVLDLEPIFHRPQAYVELSETDRQGLAMATEDLCMIADKQPPGIRFFVRGLLDVEVRDLRRSVAWGIWVELERADYQKVLDLWDDQNQMDQPPMKAQLANQIPRYENTIGMPVEVRLTGPETRPKISIPLESSHPFARECVEGVVAHRVIEWLEAMGVT
ncbi:MAG TPA: DUF2199 domain-containing protein [Pyrinomonadaceae bacterium]